MTLDQVPAGSRILVDSNILVYHFQPHPVFGPICQRLIKRVELQDLEAITSTNLLAEVAHRLMVIEAGALSGWAGIKVVNRLRQQPIVVQQLTLFQSGVLSVLQSKIRVLSPASALTATAAALSRQHGLLTNDALSLALMHQQGVTLIASHDADFDRVPGIQRYVPA